MALNACIRIAGFRVRYATDGYEIVVSDHGSVVTQIDPFVSQPNSPNSADRLCMITAVAPGFNLPAAPHQQMMHYASVAAPAAPSLMPSASASVADVPSSMPPASVAAPSSMPPVSVAAPSLTPLTSMPPPVTPSKPSSASLFATPTATELRARRLEAFATPGSEEGGGQRKRSHDTSFGSQESASSSASSSSEEALTQLLMSSPDLTALMGRLVQKELAKLLSAPDLNEEEDRDKRPKLV
jgi:hypothetical protein